MNLQQTIRRILREDDYSPAGKEITPNNIVIHKSNPVWRENILKTGLQASAGECYKTYVGYGVKCKPAIFATNSTNKRAWFDSTYDDDIWEINTEMIPDVKWYKDRHFESRSKHIVTFQDIPKEALTLKYEGNGSGDHGTWDKDSPNLYESIRKALKEETNQGKYTSALEDLTEEFKNEDCVCDIKIEYKPDEKIYLINVILGNLDMDDKFNGVNWRERDYRGKLKMKISKEVFEVLPITFFVEFKQTPRCKDYKNLQESEDKKTKSTNKEFSKYKESKFNSLRDYTLQDIVDNWDSLSDHKNENIKTIKHFINNPDKIVDLVYDEKGLEDGYHRLIAAKILKKPRFSYRLVENLRESENKKSSLLSNIEENGLYEVIMSTGLHINEVEQVVGQLSREVLDRFIIDVLKEHGEFLSEQSQTYVIDLDSWPLDPVPIDHNEYVERIRTTDNELSFTVMFYEEDEYGDLEETNWEIIPSKNLVYDNIYEIAGQLCYYLVRGQI